MLSPKRFLEIARRRRTSPMKRDGGFSHDGFTALVADKGHFVVYTADGERFMVPLAYLGSGVFKELFRMSEEEFGLPGDGPITLPCDAVFMEYAMSLIRRKVPEDVEKALLHSIFNRCCQLKASLLLERNSGKLVDCGF